MVADREAVVLRGDDLGDGARAHDLPDLDGRDVALALVHPAPHRRVEREVLHPREELTGDRVAQLLGRVLPYVRGGQAPGAGGEADLAVLGGHQNTLTRRAVGSGVCPDDWR